MMRAIALISTAMVVLGLGVTWYVSRPDGSDPLAPCRTTALAPGGPQIGGPFELVNAQGQTVTDADIITQPTLIYFGYTFCPDVCPLDAARNAEAIDVLEERGHMVTPVFISIDPTRDTPEVVGEYAGLMHERMIGLTGSEEQVAAASAAYKTYYRAHKDDPEYYLVDHSTFSYLVLPEHGFVEFFRRDLTAEQVADTAQCFIKRS